MGKVKKRSPSNRNPVIPRAGGMSWNQYSAQEKNIVKQEKESNKKRKELGK